MVPRVQKCFGILMLRWSFESEMKFECDANFQSCVPQMEIWFIILPFSSDVLSEDVSRSVAPGYIHSVWDRPIVNASSNSMVHHKLESSDFITVKTLGVSILLNISLCFTTFLTV
jgi:hypothetical protein